MKTKLLVLLFAAVTITFVACKNEGGEGKEGPSVVEEVADDTRAVVDAVIENVWEGEIVKAIEEDAAGEAAMAPEGAQSYGVDIASSKVEWMGKKIAYSHNGTVQLESGTLAVADGNLVGGEFVIDMNTIQDVDIEDPGKKAGLEAHLKGTAEEKADDFFNVTKYPTAKFVITKAVPTDNKYMISGNLTIRDITRQITFPADVEVSDNGVNAKAVFSIDRSKWGVKFGSGSFFENLGDKMIMDDMGISLNLATS